MQRTVLTSLVLAAACGLALVAQTPPPTAPQQVHADMNRLMRGVLFPAANVVFSAQADDPGQERLVLTQDPAMAVSAHLKLRKSGLSSTSLLV